MVHFSHSVARIAVWNLAGFFGVDDAKRARQVDGLALLDAELVCLVEIKPLGLLQRLAEDLNALGLDYRAIVVEQPESDLHIGLLAKAGVEVENATLLDGSEGDYADGRRALCADVKIGAFSAHLIGVHLKSGRDRPQQALRDTQCRFLGDYITQVRETPGSKTRTILLIGDFNMIPGQDVSNFHHLGGDDLMDFVSCWDLQDRFSHILSKGRANLLDGFAISRTYSTRYVRGSLRLFPMHWTMEMGREAYKEEVSDHLPFVASFRIT